MISKELLSEVLDLKMWKTETLKITFDKNNVEWCGIFLGDVGLYNSNEQINIYELAHKCKEWAFNKDCFVESAYCVKGNFSSSYAIVKSWDRFEVLHKQHSDTEHQAIFKACQWILDNKDKE